MSMEMNDKPKVIVKVKHMPLVLDYCVEHKLKFTATPRLTPDEWEFELAISDIIGAVSLGMFLRENRLEVVGLASASPKTQSSKTSKVAKTTAKKSEAEVVFAPLEKEEEILPVQEPEMALAPEEHSFAEKNEFESDHGAQTNDLLFG